MIKAMPTLGIDVGASKIYYVVLDGEARILEEELKITEKDKNSFLTLCQKINAQIKEKKIVLERVGVGVPGTIKDGELSYAPNFPDLMGWNIGTELYKIFNVPVSVFNDAKAFIFAEVQRGAAKEYKNAIGLTLGSGLGGGLYLNGALYLGRGSAGEVGHEILDLPNHKEAEDFVSAKFFQKFQSDPNTLRQQAEAGDNFSQSAFREFGNNLGVEIANLVNLLDPEAIVLGGGIAGAYDLFIEAARETAAKLIVNPASKEVVIINSALGPAAGAIGAALLAGL